MMFLSRHLTALSLTAALAWLVNASPVALERREVGGVSALIWREDGIKIRN